MNYQPDEIEDAINEANSAVTDHQPQRQPKKKKNTGAITAPEVIQNRIVDQVGLLVKTDEQASKARTIQGIKDARKDWDDYDRGYQLGTLQSVTESKARTTVEFLSQMDALRNSRDEKISEDLDGVLGELEKENADVVGKLLSDISEISSEQRGSVLFKLA